MHKFIKPIERHRVLNAMKTQCSTLSKQTGEQQHIVMYPHEDCNSNEIYLEIVNSEMLGELLRSNVAISVLYSSPVS